MLSGAPDLTGAILAAVARAKAVTADAGGRPTAIARLILCMAATVARSGRFPAIKRVVSPDDFLSFVDEVFSGTPPAALLDAVAAVGPDIEGQVSDLARRWSSKPSELNLPALSIETRAFFDKWAHELGSASELRAPEYVLSQSGFGTGPTSSHFLPLTARRPRSGEGGLLGVKVWVPDPDRPGVIREGEIVAVHHEETRSGAEPVLSATGGTGGEGHRPSDGRPDTGPGAAWLALIPEGLPADEYVSRRSAVMAAIAMVQGREGSVLRLANLNDYGLEMRQKFCMEVEELALRAYPTDRDAFDRFRRYLGIGVPGAPEAHEASDGVAGPAAGSPASAAPEAVKDGPWQGKLIRAKEVKGRLAVKGEDVLSRAIREAEPGSPLWIFRRGGPGRQGTRYREDAVAYVEELLRGAAEVGRVKARQRLRSAKRDRREHASPGGLEAEGLRRMAEERMRGENL